MRPRSITLFERTYLAGLLLDIANFAMHFPRFSVMAARTGAGDAVLVITYLPGIAIALVFWFLTARHASSTARWFLIALTALDILGIPHSLELARDVGASYGTLAVAAVAIQTLSLLPLFRKDAAAWFRNPDRKRGNNDAPTDIPPRD